MSPFLQFVELLKVLLSWPVAVLVLGLVFLFRFKPALVALINRIAVIALPWGAALQTSQPVASTETAKKPVGDTDPTTQALATAGDVAALQAQAKSERARAAMFEYMYLNTFLVPHTQIVLDWLAQRGAPITYGEYDVLTMSRVPDAAERSRIISALENHHLISVLRSVGNLIEVTPKGHEYIEWRGPLFEFLAKRAPALPPPSSPPPPEPPPPPQEPDGPTK